MGLPCNASCKAVALLLAARRCGIPCLPQVIVEPFAALLCCEPFFLWREANLNRNTKRPPHRGAQRDVCGQLKRVEVNGKRKERGIVLSSGTALTVVKHKGVDHSGKIVDS